MEKPTEIDLLFNILEVSYNEIIFLQSIKEYHKNSTDKFNNIKKGIKSLDNNFFDIVLKDPLLENYYDIVNDKFNFKTQEVNESTNLLIDNSYEIIKKIETLIKNKCDHEWITDDIDINPEQSKRICYCVKCEVTRK